MTIRILLAFFGVLFLASLGGFLLFVSMYSVATVVLVFVALLLMFALGFQLGARPEVIRKGLPSVQQ